MGEADAVVQYSNVYDAVPFGGGDDDDDNNNNNSNKLNNCIFLSP